jgi:hypothetical protein
MICHRAIQLRGCGRVVRSHQWASVVRRAICTLVTQTRCPLTTRVRTPLLPRFARLNEVVRSPRLVQQPAYRTWSKQATRPIQMLALETQSPPANPLPLPTPLWAHGPKLPEWLQPAALVAVSDRRLRCFHPLKVITKRGDGIKRPIERNGFLRVRPKCCCTQPELMRVIV